jgi:hypothetical protein
MLALRFVMPVTTASGNVAGTDGEGVAVGADEGDAAPEATDVGDAPPDDGGMGLTVTHPARSTTAAATMPHRKVNRVSTALS